MSFPDEAGQTLQQPYLTDDQRSDEEFLRDILRAMSPLWVLNTISIDLIKNPDQQQVWDTIFISNARGYPSAEKLAAVNAQADARFRLLNGSDDFTTALSRIESAGISPEWGNTEEYSYTARVLWLHVPPKAIERLQEMAADDAGITDSTERQHAAERYHRWLLQNHHPEWENYRKRWPLVEQHPYIKALP